MANIITSKTRSKIKSQPREYEKLLGDLRQHTMERHNVYSIAPVNGQSEDEVHKEIESMGAFVNESMEQNVERNRKNSKIKAEQREGMRQKTVKERVAALKSRDTKAGLVDVAQQYAKKGKAR